MRMSKPARPTTTISPLLTCQAIRVSRRKLFPRRCRRKKMPGSAINGTGQIVKLPSLTIGLPIESLVTLQIENQPQHVAKNAVRPIRVEAVLRAAVVAVIIAAPKSFAEIVLVLAHVNVVSVVAVRGIAKRVAVLRIELPVVLTIRLTRTKAFFVACIDGPSQQVSAV